MDSTLGYEPGNRSSILLGGTSKAWREHTYIVAGTGERPVKGLQAILGTAVEPHTARR